MAIIDDITNAELAGLTSDLEAAHNDTLAAFRLAVEALAEEARDAAERLAAVARRQASRRTFIGTGAAGLAAAGGAGLLLSACSGDSGTSATLTPVPAAPGDLAVIRLAASIESVAITTYTTTLQAAAKGKFGTVPPAVTQFATTAKSQHTDHRNAWNQALTAAGQAAVTTADPKLATVVAGLPLATITDVAKGALLLETVALETYVATASNLSDAGYRTTALTIAPVEAQHIAVLNFVLGNYPVSSSTVPTDQARSVSDLG
jgi:hypothetical protein